MSSTQSLYKAIPCLVRGEIAVNLCVNLRLTGVFLSCRLHCGDCGDCVSGVDIKNDSIMSPSLLDICMIRLQFLDKHMLLRKV